MRLLTGAPPKLARMMGAHICIPDFSCISKRSIELPCPELSIPLAQEIIVAHNHPSGGVEPSQSDINISAQLKAAGEIVGIELLDHIIFNRTGYFSFLEAGRL